MDPGTALAVVGLALDGIKDVYTYYTAWKDRDGDVAEIRSALLWLVELFKAIKTTLANKNHDKDQVELICKSVESCKDFIDQLHKRLNKVKAESSPDTIMAKLSDQARKAMYPFKKATIMKLLDSTEKIRDQMNDVIRLLNLSSNIKNFEALENLEQKVAFMSIDVTKIGSVITDRSQALDYEKLMKWLNPIDQSDIHADALRKHEPGTGQWFLGSDAFQNWKKDPGTSLWLHGEAGCGKTVLFSTIVKSVQASPETLDPNSNSAYFYCLYRQGDQHQLGPVLKTLIAQLCYWNSIPESLKKLFDRHSNNFPPGVPSDDELKATLLAMLRFPNEQASRLTPDQNSQADSRYLLFDALDELTFGSSRNVIVTYLNQLAAMRIPNLHIIATSRNESDIRNSLGSWKTSLLIDKEKVEKDMRSFVTNEIHKDPTLSKQKDAIKRSILHRLVDQGNGMFRWASLQLEALRILRPMKPGSITHVLKSLPKDLDETYERILTNVRTGNVREALSVLRWVSFASRPLFVEELMEVCAIQLEDDPEFDIQNRYSPDEILDMLPALITIVPPIEPAKDLVFMKHRVVFAHFSVQEYLTGCGIKSGLAKDYEMKAEYSNHFIARSSIAYLMCCNTWELRKDGFPLRSYAWDHWPWHASYRPGKSIVDHNAEAEVLSISIRQPDRKQFELALSKLEIRLSHVATWQTSTHLQDYDRKLAMRLPFFWLGFPNNWGKINKSRDDPLTMFPVPWNETCASRILLRSSTRPSKLYNELTYRAIAPRDKDKPHDDLWVSFPMIHNDTAFIRINGLLLQVPKKLSDSLRTSVKTQHSIGLEKLIGGSGFRLHVIHISGRLR